MFTDNPQLKKIFFLGFLLSLHLAFISYVNSSFLAPFAGEKNISLIYALGSIASIIVLFFIPGMLRRLGGYKFLLWSSGLNALSLLFLSVLKSSVAIIAVFILYFTLNTLIVFALDELLEIFSKNSSIGRMRGLYLSVVNIAWVIAQAVSGEVLFGFSFSLLYIIAFVIMALFFLFAFLGLKDLNDPSYDKTLAWVSFRNFFANKTLARAYAINFLLQFFYVWMVIYTPIYLYAHLGFTWKEISIMFMIMLLPFVLIQFPLGRRADKIGERNMLMFGFVVAACATVSLFFIHRHEVWIWALALCATRVGAAVIEVMSDVYFFKHIKSENDEFISIYRNTAPLAYVLAPLAALLVFSFVPSFNFIFLVLGALMLAGVYLSSTIVKTDI